MNNKSNDPNDSFCFVLFLFLFGSVWLFKVGFFCSFDVCLLLLYIKQVET